VVAKEGGGGVGGGGGGGGGEKVRCNRCVRLGAQERWL
jgi:hypothetical protein